MVDAQMRALLSFRGSSEDTLGGQGSPCAADLQDMLNGFHESLLQHCDHAQLPDDAAADDSDDTPKASFGEKLLALLLGKDEVKDDGLKDTGPSESPCGTWFERHRAQ